MILGMSLSAFTAVHVAISLIAIASGAFTLLGMLRSRQPAGLTAVFLLSTIATDVTGFLFPFTHIRPGHVIGAVSLVALVPTLLALYQHRLTGPWRWIYVTGVTTQLYFNGVIAVRQAFAKIDFLLPLAPSPTALPLVGTQLVVLAVFVVLGVLAVKRFHPQTTAQGSSTSQARRNLGDFAEKVIARF